MKLDDPIALMVALLIVLLFVKLADLIGK